MNRFQAKITEIYEEERLHIVEFDSCGIPLRMMGLELPEGARVGSSVWLGCKPSHVILAQDFQGEISLSNKIPAQIIHLEKGRLLSSVHLRTDCGNLQSVITQKSSERMNLREGTELLAMIKASELSILEIDS